MSIEEEKASELRKYQRSTRKSALVLYGFDTCEPCQDTKKLLNELQAQYTGKVRFFYQNCQGKYDDVKKECYKQNMSHLPILWMYNHRHKNPKKPVNYDYHTYFVDIKNITNFINYNMQQQYEVITSVDDLNTIINKSSNRTISTVYIFQIFDEVSNKFQALADKFEKVAHFIFIIDFDKEQLEQIENQAIKDLGIEPNTFNMVIQQNNEFVRYDGQQIVDKVEQYLQKKLLNLKEDN